MEEKGFSDSLVDAVMAEPRATAMVQEPEAQSEGREDLPVPIAAEAEAEAPTPNRDDEEDIEGGVSL